MRFLKVEELRVEQKIGMVLCGRRWREEDIEFMVGLVKNHALGAVQGHATEPENLKRILDAADYPIIVVNDAEQGFPTTKLPKIPINSLAAARKPEYLRAFAKGIVRDAKAAHFSGNWGPVIDVLECDGPDKVHRTFSDNAETVAELAEEIAKVFIQNHYFSCGKHYPGLSGLPVDTHMREGYSEYTKEYIIKHNLVPYVHLLKKGLLPTIMVGHTVFKNIDPDYPASLSKKIIDIIRELGFDGVMFTDSFAMMGILQRFGEENIYGMAMAAGNDLIVPNYRTSVEDCYNMLMQNYKDGVFTEQRLNEAVRRVLALQEFVGTEPENPTEFTKEDEALLNHVARDCITAITDDGVSAALTDENKEKLFIVMTDNGFDPAVDIPEIATDEWYLPDRVAKRIKENFPGSEIAFIPEFSTWKDHEIVLNKATAYKEVVVITYCNTFCYLGTDGLTKRAEAWINSLQYSGKISAIVHFGNPYALKTIKHVPRRIFGYMISESQEYAIDVLAGKCEAKGVLPFDIQFD
ncbi:MAG: hypothetical protein IKJ55_00230 [Clostridia bacterium]|nr:hypothetical protein [Clostridia bacterium]